MTAMTGVLHYRPLADKRISTRITEVLSSWKGTPHIKGQQVKGEDGGVDCLRFVTGSLDELTGREYQRFNHLPPDSSMHVRSAAIAIMKSILEFYNPIERVTTDYLEDGDILVSGMKGPGHGMLVGEGVLWHASGTRVCYTGLKLVDHYQKLFGIFRPMYKESWI